MLDLNDFSKMLEIMDNNSLIYFFILIFTNFKIIYLLFGFFVNFILIKLYNNNSYLYLLYKVIL